MVNAIESNIDGEKVTTFGYVSSNASSSNNESTNSNEVTPIYSEKSITSIVPFSYTSNSYLLTSSMTLIETFNLPYSIYLENLSVETLNGTAQFYIQLNNISFNSALNPGTCFSSVNYSYQIPYLPYLEAQNQIRVYALSTGTGVMFHYSISGFRA